MSQQSITSFGKPAHCHRMPVVPSQCQRWLPKQSTLHVLARVETLFDKVGGTQQGRSQVAMVGRIAAARALQLPSSFHQPFYPYWVPIVHSPSRAVKGDSLNRDAPGA